MRRLFLCLGSVLVFIFVERQPEAVLQNARVATQIYLRFQACRNVSECSELLVPLGRNNGLSYSDPKYLAHKVGLVKNPHGNEHRFDTLLDSLLTMVHCFIIVASIA